MLKNDIAHAEGKYEYQTERMQDMDPNLKHRLEEENDARWLYNQQEGGDHQDVHENDERWRYNEQEGGDHQDEHEHEQEEETSDMEIESDFRF